MKIKNLFRFRKKEELTKIANSQGKKAFWRALWADIGKGVFLGIAFVVIVFFILLFFFGEGADHPEYDPAKEFMREQQRENLQDDKKGSTSTDTSLNGSDTTPKEEKGSDVTNLKDSEIIKKVTNGNYSAYIQEKNNKNYIILEKEKEKIVLEEGYTDHKTIEEKGLKLNRLKDFSDLRFSPQGNYLIYSEGGWESYLQKHVYDVQKEEYAFKFRGGKQGFNFTQDEEFFYVCSNVAVGKSLGALVYKVPEFEVVYDAFENLSLREVINDTTYVGVVKNCVYEKYSPEHIQFTLTSTRENSNKHRVKYFLDKNKAEVFKITTEKKEIFTVPEEVFAAGYCKAKTCEERGLDPIEGSRWEYEISPNYKNYAYIAKTKKDGKLKEFVIFNGEKQKKYDRVYFLKFGPNGDKLVYHAYNEKRGVTYLVVNGEELPVYGVEGYPQAAGGISSDFSKDGNHFAYGESLPESNKMSIILDGEKINTIDAYFFKHFGFDKNNDLIYIVSENKPDSKTYSYYKNGDLVKRSTLEEDDIGRTNRENLPSLFKKHLIRKENDCSLASVEGKNRCNNKVITKNGEKIADYSDRKIETCVQNLICDSAKKNIAFVVKEGNNYQDTMFVSLNGKKNKTQKYDDVRNLHFSKNGEELIYIAREGRTVYRVTHKLSQ